MKEDTKQAVLAKLKKAQGMLNKVTSMVEEDRYCIDVLQQSLAARGYMKSVDKLILENHLNCCFRKGMSADKLEQNKLISEVLRIVNKI
jgi:DNA-binding FrmR family transcriptional regulator